MLDKTNKLKLNDIYDSLLMLPSLREFDEENAKILGDLALCLGDPEALLDFIMYFGGKTITIPKIEDVEYYLKLVCSYKQNIDKGIRGTSVLSYTALYNNNLKMDDDNKKRLRDIDKHLKKIRQEKG